MSARDGEPPADGQTGLEDQPASVPAADPSAGAEGAPEGVPSADGSAGDTPSTGSRVLARAGDVRQRASGLRQSLSPPVALGGALAGGIVIAVLLRRLRSR